MAWLQTKLSKKFRGSSTGQRIERYDHNTFKTSPLTDDSAQWHVGEGLLLCYDFASSGNQRQGSKFFLGRWILWGGFLLLHLQMELLLWHLQASNSPPPPCILNPHTKPLHQIPTMFGLTVAFTTEVGRIHGRVEAWTKEKGTYFIGYSHSNKTANHARFLPWQKPEQGSEFSSGVVDFYGMDSDVFSADRVYIIMNHAHSESNSRWPEFSPWNVPLRYQGVLWKGRIISQETTK